MEDLKSYLNTLRHDFTQQTLDELSVFNNPFEQFEKWMKEAIDAKVNEPNAMAIATVSILGKPSSRIVLLRGFDTNGFVFYTNYNSRKGIEIKANPNAALLFFWPELERQIRIEGVLKKQSTQESDDYFNSRPRESKLGAWSSEQSKSIVSREVINENYELNNKKYKEEIPRPDFWGGYVLIPENFEFWQGRASRLHDRIHYALKNENWHIERLSP